MEIAVDYDPIREKKAHSLAVLANLFKIMLRDKSCRDGYERSPR
jgi:hypothetical protein